MVSNPGARLKDRDKLQILANADETSNSLDQIKVAKYTKEGSSSDGERKAIREE